MLCQVWHRELTTRSVTDVTSAQPSYLSNPSDYYFVNMSNIGDNPTISWRKNKLKALQNEGQVTMTEVNGWVSCEEKLVATQVITQLFRVSCHTLIVDHNKTVFNDCDNSGQTEEHLATLEEVKRVLTRMEGRRRQAQGATEDAVITSSGREKAAAVVVETAEFTPETHEDDCSESTSGIDTDDLSDSTSGVDDDDFTKSGMEQPICAHSKQEYELAKTPAALSCTSTVRSDSEMEDDAFKPTLNSRPLSLHVELWSPTMVDSVGPRTFGLNSEGLSSVIQRPEKSTTIHAKERGDGAMSALYPESCNPDVVSAMRVLSRY